MQYFRCNQAGFRVIYKTQSILGHMLEDAQEAEGAQQKTIGAEWLRADRYQVFSFLA
jgi:hypothetical protein